jgi:hypothetical protein
MGNKSSALQKTDQSSFVVVWLRGDILTSGLRISKGLTVATLKQDIAAVAASKPDGRVLDATRLQLYKRQPGDVDATSGPQLMDEALVRTYQDPGAALEVQVREVSLVEHAVRRFTPGSLTLGDSGVRKRDIRMACRVATVLASVLLVLNVLTLHSFEELPWYAACTMVAAALGNLFAAFVDEGSCASFCASAADLFFAFGTALVFLLQSEAQYSDALSGTSFHRPAWRRGLHLFSFILEVIIVVWVLVISGLGQAVDEEIVNKKDKKRR